MLTRLPNGRLLKLVGGMRVGFHFRPARPNLGGD
jgi:hypothetical protein